MKTKNEPKRGAPAGNKNAAKADGLDDTLTFRCLSAERAAWMKAKGKDAKLTNWVRETLNTAAKRWTTKTTAVHSIKNPRERQASNFIHDADRSSGTTRRSSE